MKNLAALLFVVVYLSACAAFTYQNTHRGMQPFPIDPGTEQWRDARGKF
jgi:hypothetical protein